MAKPSTPWEEARAAHPDALLVRILFADRGLQCFMRLNPTPERRADASLMDGATVVTPSQLGGRTPEEFDHIVEDFDAAWREANA